MDLSEDILDGLQLLGDTARIDDVSFQDLVRSTCQCLLNEEDMKDGSGSDSGVLKQAHVGLATLLLEAARQDKHHTTLGHTLEECKCGADRILFVENTYKEYKNHLRLLLSNTGTSLPHIVDVDWKLDYLIKSSQSEKVGKPVYSISLKTEQGNEDGLKNVNFTCTMEQLQDLVGKLKDACKCIEKASQM